MRSQVASGIELLKSWLSNRDFILGYPHEPDVITGILIVEKGEEEVRVTSHGKDLNCYCCLWRQAALEARKVAPGEEFSSAHTFVLTRWNPCRLPTYRAVAGPLCVVERPSICGNFTRQSLETNTVPRKWGSVFLIFFPRFMIPGQKAVSFHLELFLLWDREVFGTKLVLALNMFSLNRQTICFLFPAPWGDTEKSVITSC